MNSAFEPVMSALFAQLKTAAAITFSATATAGSAILTAVSPTAGMFAGLPVFGPGCVENAVIAQVDTSTITLSDPLTQSSPGASFITGFQTTGRRVQHWTQVAAQPALFLRRIGVQDEAQEPYTVTTLNCEAWIYCNAGQDPDTAPDSALTCLEQMVRACLMPGIADDEGRFTLGGLVYWCRVEGHSDISPGDQAGQAIARIPIRVTLP